MEQSLANVHVDRRESPNVQYHRIQKADVEDIFKKDQERVQQIRMLRNSILPDIEIVMIACDIIGKSHPLEIFTTEVTSFTFLGLATSWLPGRCQCMGSPRKFGITSGMLILPGSFKDLHLGKSVKR